MLYDRLAAKNHQKISAAVLGGLCYYTDRIRLPRGLCSTSARPSASSKGGIYMPNLPRRPFLSPYHPPRGFFAERPQDSTVPSLAGFCSSALPSSIQPPCFLSILCRSFIARLSYKSVVLPTAQTITGMPSFSSRYISYSEVSGGVFNFHGSSFVPAAT